jgi:hypothetical protein
MKSSIRGVKTIKRRYGLWVVGHDAASRFETLLMATTMTERNECFDLLRACLYAI